MLNLTSRSVLVSSCLCALLGVASCASPREVTVGGARSALTQSIVYVGKQSTVDFRGYGQFLQYWPLFGATLGITAQRTDCDRCIELTPAFAAFKHHYLLAGRTFSNDALGVPLGTKTAGGFPTWDTFTLPDGTVGRSGTFYDTFNIDNSNNTVNELRIDVSTLHEFCLNLITDNTAGEHDPDVRLQARSDTAGFDLRDSPDLSFDGRTDMYTFRYTGMAENDVIKIRFQCSSASGCMGSGLGGIMVSDISTCSDGFDAGAAPDAGDVDAGAALDAGDVDAGAAPDAGDVDTGVSVPGGTSGGCGCRVAGSKAGPSGSLFALFALALVLRRRTKSC